MMIQLLGTIKPPPQFGNTGQYAANPTGLIVLLSNLVKFFIVVGGLWAFFNIILAGFTYITAGDNPEELAKASQRLYMSLVGLVVMLASFILASIISYVLYGDATTILNPQLYGPTSYNLVR